MVFAKGVQELAGSVVGDLKAYKMDAAEKETSDRLLKEHPEYANLSKDEFNARVQSDPAYKAVADLWGTGGTKPLEDVRFRFYGNTTPAKTQGEMVGARLVREWDPATGQTRTWYETLDHSGNVRSVAPKPVTDEKNHHIFDADGNYQGWR
ncbi:hypothetical protein CBW22_19465 [Pantoea sp. VS1]|uniref:hypothetical protein n=1 Tax=Pantoea sp. VS1 TaxID=2003658 RepID=UPI000B63CACE|nr:hypothetical protein [Pantoea sp. VS1]OWS73935.1 hypothetical protein CBW22_19465 [Pantoea sp. VS1]